MSRNQIIILSVLGGIALVVYLTAAVVGYLLFNQRSASYASAAVQESVPSPPPPLTNIQTPVPITTPTFTPSPNPSPTSTPVVLATGTSTSTPESQSSQMLLSQSPVTAPSRVQADLSQINIKASGSFVLSEPYPLPNVLVTVTGGVAADAYRYGLVAITSVIGDGNQFLPLQQVTGPLFVSFDRLDEKMDLIDRSSFDYPYVEPLHPVDGFAFQMIFKNPDGRVQQIKELRGKISVQIPDPAQIVDVGEFGELFAQMSEHGPITLAQPELQDRGTFSLYLDEGQTSFYEQFSIKGVGGRVGQFDARLVDPQGQVIPSLGFAHNKGRIVNLPFPDQSEQYRLQLIFGYSPLIDIPFNLVDINLN